MYAWLFLVLGGLIAALNFYLSYIDYPLHRWQGGSREEYRCMSGYPFIGTVLLTLAAWMFHSAGVSIAYWFAIFAIVFDTGGPHWLAIIMIWEGGKSFLHWIRKDEQ